MDPINDLAVELNRNIRFRMEQRLAKKLLAVFNDPQHGLIGNLRSMVKAALDNLPEHILLAAAQEERFLSIWHTRGGLETIRREWNQLTASECSDIIRLYGAAIEEMPKKGVAKGASLDKLKGGYRQPGLMKDWDGKDMVWDQVRYRARGPDQRRHPGKPDPRQQAPGWYDFHTVWAYSRGIDLKQPFEWSTVKKIDLAFGLPVGADISGTTADSLFFIERFARVCRIPYDPIYQLLPVATLVAARHHALLEVALTLTLNKKISGVEYQIGFYSTLLPTDTTHGAAGAVDAVLKECENSGDNNHILVYFDQQHRVVGGYVAGKDDVGRFRQLATTGRDFLWRFVMMPPWPTKLRIERLMGSFGLVPD